MAAWRMRPPNVRQTENTCWAAAIASYSRVTGGVPNWMRVDHVIDEFAIWTPSPVHTDRTLDTPKGFVQFAAEYGLQVEEVLIQSVEVTPEGRLRLVTPTPSPGVTHVRAVDLSLRHFSEKLRTSHVVVVLPPADPGKPAHVVVVYGADAKRVYYMDPNARRESDALRERAKYDEFGQGGLGSQRYLLIWKP